MEIDENSQNSISSCQSTSSTQDTCKKIYNHLFSLNSEEEYQAFIRNRMPRTQGLNSHSRTYCKVDKTVAKHPTKIDKHMIKLSDLFNFRVKGYDPIRVFNVNKARGRKRGKKNPLAVSDDE